MKFFYITKALIILFTLFNLNSFAQGTVTLGTGTTYNTNTAYPTPYGTYRKNMRVQYLILKSELNALGVSAGNISAIGFNVYSIGTIKAMPNYSIKIKTTTATTQGTTFDNADLKEVWNSPSFLPANGWNTHTFSTPFYWDNNSNILIDICFDMLSSATSQNAQVYYTANASYMATHYSSDNYTACGTSFSASRSYNRANMQITWATTSCPPPISLNVQNITTSTAQLGWTERGSATQWNIEVGLPGFTPGTGTYVKNAIGTTNNPWTVSGLDTLTYYEFYVQANCGGSLSQWEGAYTFQTQGVPMSGNYTIDKTQATLGKNFNSFFDMANALNNSLIDGPVVIDVAAGSGPYYEQAIINELQNTSSTNTITINGNNEILEYLSTNLNERATLKLNGTNYLNVNKLIVKTLGTSPSEYGLTVQLMNNAEYITFDSCQFLASTTATLTQISNFVASNSTSSVTFDGLAVNHLTVKNCIIEGGGYALAINGPASEPFAQSNSIINNEIKDFAQYGIYMSNQTNSIISENKITRPTRTNNNTFYMIGLSSNMGNVTVVKNQLSEFSAASITTTVYGIYGMIKMPITENMLIANNIISGFQNTNGAQTGIYLNTSTQINVNLYHNTVSLDNVTHTGSGSIYPLYCLATATSTIDLRNNILSYTSNSSGSKYCFYYNGAFTLNSNNNLFYEGATSGTNNMGYWNPSTFQTLNNWQAHNSNTYDQNSVSANPCFVAPLQTPRQILADNLGDDLSSVIDDDILGVLRPTAPDPGAIEFTGIPCIPPTTLTVSNIVSDVATLGWTEIASATTWNVEVGMPGFTPGNNEEFTGITGVANTSWVATGLDVYTDYEFYVQSDCGSGDLSTWTGPFAFKTLGTLLSGTYTINNTQSTGGTNFNSFNDLADALTIGGFAGPVTVNVVAGTGPYTEAFVVNELNFNDATNTLTINGNNETLQYLSTDNYQRATFKLNGTDYVTVNDLIIIAMGSNSNEYGFAAHMKGSANNNTFNNCQFMANITSDLANFAAFVMNDNDTSATAWSKTTVANNLTVNNCTSIGGYYGMAICGASISYTPADSITIRNNEIKDFYIRGLVIIGANNSLIESNTISRPERANGANIEMLHLASYMNGTVVSKNIVSGFSAVPNNSQAIGISSNQIIAASGGGLLIANNLIYGFQNMNAGQTGISLNTNSTSDIFKVYHNTVSLDNTSYSGSSGITCLGLNGSNDNLDLKNNIFSFTTNTSGTKYIYNFGTGSGLILSSNNNVLHMGYVAGTTRLAYKFPSNYNTLADWQAIGYDINSSNADPTFINPLRTPTNATVANIGANLLSVVPDDISGASRTTTPDPGVLEFVPQTCLQPTAIALNNYSEASAVFNWTEQGTATLWDTEVGTTGFTPGTGTSVVSQTDVNTKPCTVTGLSPNTGYEFYVRSNCGGGDLSPWVGPYQFKTLCSNFTTFDEDFDGVTPIALPDCWRKAGETGAISSYANQPYSSPNCLAITAINSTVVMPPVSNAGAGTHMLRLIGKVGSPQTARLQVGYLTNPTDPNTFVMIDSVKFISTSYFEYDIYLGTAPGSNNLLAIKAMSSHGFYLDDIRWMPICTAPTAQNITALTSTTANFAWTESGSATLWDVEVGTQGYLPGTGTATASGTDITSTTWQATGLSPNTAYDFYVRSDCGFNYSSWVGPITFTTPCTPTTLPVIENVDLSTFPNCWTQTAANIWDIRNSNNAGGTPYEFRALFNAFNGISRLISPPINTTGLSSINLKFLTTLTPNISGATLKIQSSADGINWTDEGWSKTSTQSVFGGTEVNIDITNNLGATTFIAWVIDGDHMAYNNWRIDNISVRGCSPCSNLSANNITPTTANITWNAGDAETLWNIEWGTASFAKGTGTSITGHNSTTYNLTGLTDYTSYDFYVQADCISDESSWAGPYSFKTECYPLSSLPWTEGFENVSTPEFPDCWTFGNGGWATQTNAYSTMDADARTGSQFLTDNWDATNEFMWTPGFELTGGTSYDLSFWWAGDNYSGWTGDVFFNTSHNTSGATVLGASFVVSGTTTTKTYQKVLRTFTPATDGVYFFALRVSTDNPNAWYISFDDFRLEEAPLCGTPTEVSTSDITSISVEISWTTGSNQNQWDAEIGLSGFTPGTGSSKASITSVSTNSWEPTGLTPNTAYDIYVRAQCNGGGYSYWSDVESFTTLCGLFGLPYEDGFENNICWWQMNIDGGGSQWGISTTANHTIGGTNCAYHNYGDPGYAETGMLYSPQIVFPSGVTIELSFWSYNAIPASYGKNSLLISTDGTNYSEIWSPASVTEAWVQTTLDLSAYAGNTINLAFKYEGTNAHKWYMDDIKITQNLIVNASNQLITSNSTYEDVTITPNGELTLNNSSILSVNGDFIIESDATGTGSFIQDGTLNVSGDIIVQKYLPNTTISGWTLSVPVQNTTNEVFNGSDNIWFFNTSVAEWQSFGTGQLEQMTGYVVRFPVTTTLEFEGVLNNGTMIRNDLIRSDSPNNFGWNYVGNPYPSPIDWDANPGISRTNLNNAIYFRNWDGGVDAYVDGQPVNNGTNIIPSMQAFWVQVASGQTNGSLQITNEARLHASNDTYKATTANVLSLKIQRDGFTDETVVRFRELATPNFDGEFDAAKMFSYNEAHPQIYTFTQQGEDLAINALPQLTGHTIVPITFKTGTTGTHTIIASGLNTFENGISISLEDLDNNTLTDLSQNNTYTFSTSAGTNNNRFLLHFNPSTAEIVGNETSQNQIEIYTYDNAIYISNVTEENTTVHIYNVLGQEVLSQQLVANTLNKVNTNLATGQYVVKVTGLAKVASHKVFLK